MSDWLILKRLFLEARVFFWSLLSALLLYLPVTLLALAQPLIIGVAVDRGFLTGDIRQIGIWAGAYLAAVLLHGGTELFLLFVMQRTGQQMVRGLREKLFAKIQRLPMSYFDKTPMGRTLTRVTNDVEAVNEMFSSGAVQIFGDLFFVIAIIIMLFTVNIRLSFLAMLVMPVLAIGMWLFRKWAKKIYHLVRSRLARLNAFVQEYLSGMQTVQHSVQVNRIIKEFDEQNIEYMAANHKSITLDAAVYSFVDTMSYIATAGILYAGMLLEGAGALQIGIMVAFLDALGRFFIPVRELSNKFTIFQSALVAADRVFSLLDKEEEKSEPQIGKEPSFKSSIAFDRVNFSYENGGRVLHELSFKIDKGQKVALVGHTGAGKSTVTRLITRFYDLSEGKITIDGSDIRDFGLGQLRGLFNVVPQEVFLLSGTLRENLSYGKNDVSDQGLKEALQSCQADYLLSRAGGLDCRVETRGQNFSLGERQLIALARALVADPQILILDEATASVDPDTERRLQRATKNLIGDRTSIIVAHRLSTISDCDKILVFHKGLLVEEGNHNQLLKEAGIYAKLVALQKTELALARPEIV